VVLSGLRRTQARLHPVRRLIIVGETAKPEKALPPAQRALARLTGARLCFGRPVEAKGRTIIGVASVRTAGGWGFGNGPNEQGSGGGGGGALDARPVGFIEIGPDGTRFERIDDGRLALRAIAAGSLALLVAGRVLTRRRRGALRTGPSRRRLRRVRQISQRS